MLHPIIVRQYDFEGNYEILSRHKRVESHKEEGLDKIKALFVKTTEE